jgi:hypothetical protein
MIEIGLYFNYKEKGPGKVVDNLIKGLDLSGIKYRINSDGDVNLILQNCNRLSGNLSKCFLGPNICTLPIDNQYVMNMYSYNKLLVPSEWVKNLYKRWIPEEKIEIWPVGIDTDKFTDKSKCEKEYDFLVYFKRRNTQDLHSVLSKLKENNLTYKVLEYGNYVESEFIDFISKSKYGFVVDNCESQGIAIQEMMSCNLPLIVFDSKEWVDRGDQFKCESTSVPYWDSERCGVVIDQIDDFNLSFIDRKYDSRDFITENLSLNSSILKLEKIIAYNGR